MRRYSLTVDTPSYESKQIIILLADIIVLIRKDLGYNETQFTKDDFLHIKLLKANNFLLFLNTILKYFKSFANFLGPD